MKELSEMACFLVAAAVGIFTTAFHKKVPEQYHIGWLNIMIWASVLALLLEHMWHGEIVPWFPFLTAMSDPAETEMMLQEMASIGIPMLLVVVVAWAAMVFLYNKYTATQIAGDTA